MNANLSLWHRERALWRKESSCDASCACSTQPWFRSISSSEAELSKGLLCAAVECSELAVDDGSVVPKLYAPTCTRGECDHVDCLKKKLEQLRACKTEFADSDTLVRYRKYAKMERTRNDGSKYTEVPRARVSRLAPRSASGHRSCSPMHTVTGSIIYGYSLSAPTSCKQVEFVSSIESYPEHRRAHNWAVRQRKLVIERLKQELLTACCLLLTTYYLLLTTYYLLLTNHLLTTY